MPMMVRRLPPLAAAVLALALGSAPGLVAQAPPSAPPPAGAASPSPSPSPTPPPPPRSPEVGADRTVTFRFRAPNAREVLLAREGTTTRQPMLKDAEGVWSVTTGPLEPDLYGYTFVADGVTLADPSNPVMKPNLRTQSSMVHVPGPGLPWEVAAVPRGQVHRHFYRSRVVGDDRDFYVYTPPGYDPHATTRYPVLYLLHGYSDGADAWTAVGRAHVILDNLIAQGRAKPMLVVMPLGYGILDPFTGYLFADVPRRLRNFDGFRQALLTEVVPEVETGYKVATDPGSRAITGLSMGGAESLLVGLNALDRFAWVGGFSAGGFGAREEDLNPYFPNLDASANSRLRLLWIACGTEDGLIDVNRRFRQFLDARGVKHTAVETPGAHTWLVWRRYLATLVPMLFR
jgi:enterochelin esterase family protein